MYNEDVKVVCESAYKKASMVKKSPLSYFVLSILAGFYAAFGVLLAYTVGGYLHNFEGYKLVMGFCFTAALSLVYFGGSELFTGNNFVMGMGAIKKRVTWLDAIKVWVVCYIGNFVGSIIIASLAMVSGVVSGEIGSFIAEYSQTKMGLDPIQIISRAILCNMLVSLATWCCYRMKSESGKLIMVFWCIIVFFTVGFEHCVANMALLFIGTINPYETANTFTGMFYNISLATIGNMIGGILFLAVPYLIVAKGEEK